MRDVGASEIRSVDGMLGVIRSVYESYGFEPLDTPAFEYADALGKFLPDQDRPNEGVFSFEDEDKQWLSLRYDLTAPLARFVAQNFDLLPKPFRRYQIGPVWRNEKPGPGRFRQFIQFDADTVGAPGPAADAELCMLASDALERLGVPRGSYIVKVSSRKLLDGVLETIGVTPDDPANASQRLTVLRAIDKLDRLGLHGVEALLGEGRKDESGAFTKGAGLGRKSISGVLDFVGARAAAADGSRESVLAALDGQLKGSRLGEEGAAELRQMGGLLDAAGFGADQVSFDPGVVRGLDYYTGPVLEAELTFEAAGDDGQIARFGSVGGGGRYDGLVERFRGAKVPATGFSVGVSRLYEALKALGRIEPGAGRGPVVVLVMDRNRIADSQALTRTLRTAGVRAEMYLGGSGMKAQMKYADKRGAPCVIIQGEDERARGEVTIKDLVEGKRLSSEIVSHDEWRDSRPAQFSVKAEEMVGAIQDLLARRRS
jgi:histidyl-tRNA synthetase